MRDFSAFWQQEKRSFEKARKAFRRSPPEGLEEFSAVLDRIAAAARAAGNRKLARRARRMNRRPSRIRALEADRRLLARVRRLSLLSAEAAAALDARWEDVCLNLTKGAMRKTRGRPLRRLRRALSRRTRAGEKGLAARLEAARRRCLERLDLPGKILGDAPLSRFQAASDRARHLALALAQAGGPRYPEAAGEQDQTRTALRRWTEARRFRKRLSAERRDAERRGAVTLARELDRLASALDRTLDRARREAIAQAHSTSNVVSFTRRSA